MKIILILSAVLIAALGGWFSLPWLSPTGEPLRVQSGSVERGAYLARASGCIGCHTDINGGGLALAGGAPLDTPFGRFYPPNITTDPTVGLGNWTLDDFATALRIGRSPSGKPYYPAFPYDFYQNFSDQDIADLWSAFQTVPPVNKAAPAHQLGFPFSLRDGLFLWQALFVEPAKPVDPSKDERYQRGEFLTEGAAHCAACHTPRNLVGALDHSRAYQGGISALKEGGNIPPITAEALRSNGWSLNDIAYGLKTGIKPDGDLLGGSMGEIIKESSSFLSDEDRKAIAWYLLNRSPN